MKYEVIECVDGSHLLYRNAERAIPRKGRPTNAELEFWLEIERLRFLLNGFKTRATGLLPDLEMAQLANGGAEHKTEWCQCDPDVGACPCQYCAIHDGLRRAVSLTQDLVACNPKE